MMRSVVDLPQPEGPTRQTKEPCRTSKPTSARISSSPNLSLMLRSEIAIGGAARPSIAAIVTSEVITVLLPDEFVERRIARNQSLLLANVENRLDHFLVITGQGEAELVPFIRNGVEVLDVHIFFFCNCGEDFGLVAFCIGCRSASRSDRFM